MRAWPGAAAEVVAAAAAGVAEGGAGEACEEAVAEECEEAEEAGSAAADRTAGFRVADGLPEVVVAAVAWEAVVVLAAASETADLRLVAAAVVAGAVALVAGAAASVEGPVV